jgi:hypothetical protein
MSRLFAAALLAALVLAAPAQAAWFGAEAIDGPSADILAFGDIDMARDGTGGLVYVKNEGGVPHIFLSRHYLGVWRAPERVDLGVETSASEPVIAAGDDHRLAIVWVSGGRLFGSVAPGGPPAPLPTPALLYADPDPLLSVSDPHVDLGINGTAYTSFTAPGPGGGDVRAVRLQGTTWEGVAGPLDISLDEKAGVGAGRSRIAVSAEGNAVAVWGETHADGRNRVYGRRLNGLVLSVAPQEISLPDFEGVPGGPADSPDLDIEDDGSYAWVVFREDFDGRSRALARRLVGSLFEPPTPIDGGGPADAPRVGMSGRGVGIATVGTSSRAVQVSLLERDAFGNSLRVDANGSADPPIPVATTGEREESIMAWRATTGPGTGEVRARYRPEAKAFDPEQVVSTPDFGPAAPDGLEATEDRLGDFVLGYLQGVPGSYRVVTSVFDRPPGTPFGLSSAKPRKTRRATLKWRPGSDLWGAQTFKLLIDGVPAQTTDRSFVTLKTPLIDGAHTWQVIAVDRRGQESPMKVRTLRVDGTAPYMKVTIAGKRKAGMPIKLAIEADDGSGGYGVSYVEVDWGDGSPRFRGLAAQHRYRRGKFSLAVKSVDKARNVTRRVYSLRIKK